MAEKRQKIVTPDGRLSFPALFKPRGEDEYDAGKYTATILVPKANAAALKPLEDLIAAVTFETWGPKPPKFKFQVLNDGDEKEDPNFHGYICLTAKTTLKPRVYRAVGGAYVQVTDPAELYPGCWVRMNVHCHPYGPGAPGGNKQQKFAGITLSLNSVLFVRDDESFVSSADPVDEFGAPPENAGGEVGEMEEIRF